MVRTGHRMADLERKACAGEDVKDIRLSDYRGKWLAMVSCPADFTFVRPGRDPAGKI